MSPILRYTGHPILDVGVATVVAFSNKTRPEELNTEDLQKVAEFLVEEYVSGSLSSYLSCVFTTNSVYMQPSWGPERRLREARELLQSWCRPPSTETTALRCAFSGEPATFVAYRQHLPLLTGERVLNFMPAGLGGLPVAGRYLLAAQAFPLGSRRCLGRALAVHSPDDHSLTYEFARRFLAQNRQLMLLAREAAGGKFHDAKAPRTLVINELLSIEEERQTGTEGPPPSVTVYHLSNSGQGPNIDVLQLPSQVIGFLREASRAGTHRKWKAIQQAAWQRERRRSRRKAQGTEAADQQVAVAAGKAERFRNFLYDDLFFLPENAARFIRTYFLRRAVPTGREDDPRREYRLFQELDLVSWDLTRLLLREVMGVEKARLLALQTVADRVADQIVTENDRRLFQGIYRVRRYTELRNLLIKASAGRLKHGVPPLIGFDEFIQVFEPDGDRTYSDWSLARDLLLIRIVEKLHAQGWFGKAPEALEALAEEDEEEMT